MRNKKALKKYLKKFPRIYCILKVFQKWDSPVDRYFIKEYLMNSGENLPLLVNHSDKLISNSPLYLIQYGVNDVCEMGFFALMRHTIKYLPVAERLCCKPVIVWGKNTYYYEKEYAQPESNVFNYYFEPVSDIHDIHDIHEVEAYPIINAKTIDFEQIWPTQNGYCVDKNDVVFWGETYKKYIRLNELTNKYIMDNVKKMIDGKKVLGVHIRGTDFSLNLVCHPKMVSTSEYLDKAKKIFWHENYDKIFLATEDNNAIEEFKREFGDNLLFYDDVLRSNSNISPHSTENNRDLHHYKLGLEVLRDVYTLAYCKSLLCGLSQVSFAARYINYALERQFDSVIVIEHGINSKLSASDRRIKREVKRKRKELKP